jgi:hypothetical protein
MDDVFDCLGRSRTSQLIQEKAGSVSTSAVRLKTVSINSKALNGCFPLS